MSTVNRVELTGGLVRDPDLRAVGTSGTFVCEFVLAVREAYWDRGAGQDAVRTHYIGCVAWGDTAGRIGEQFRRGDELYVLGELTQEKIERGDGKPAQSKTKVRVTLASRTRKRTGVLEPEPDAEGNLPKPAF